MPDSNTTQPLDEWPTQELWAALKFKIKESKEEIGRLRSALIEISEYRGAENPEIRDIADIAVDALREGANDGA